MDKKVILCVDDDEIILKCLLVQLRSHFGTKFEYELSTSPFEAFEIIEELTNSGSEIVAIISDWLMPDMNGDKFLIEVHKKHPDIIKIMLTGNAGDTIIEKIKEEANLTACFFKPWDKNKLFQTLEGTISQL